MEPEIIVKGSDKIWKKDVSISLEDGRTVGSAAESWVLKYRLRGPNAYTITATQYGTTSTHSVTLTSSTTDSYAAGDYWWNSWVEKGTERFDVAEGRLTVKANPATETGVFDGSTHAQKMLTAIESMMEGTASREEEEYKIEAPGGGGRSLRLFSRAELIGFYSFYKRLRQSELDSERIASGLGAKSKILSRFIR